MKVAHQTIPALLVSGLSLTTLLPLSVSAEWGVGISMETAQSMYKKNNTNDKELMIQATPRIEYNGERLKIHNGKLSYAAIQADKYAIDLLATSKNYGYKAKDKDIFKGMSERKPSLDMGVRLRSENTYIPMSIDVTKDIYKSKGAEIGLSIGGIKPLKKHWTGQHSVSIAPIAGLDWQSKKVVDYYYGVKDSEATAIRKAHKGKAAITPFLGLEMEAKVSKHFAITGGAKYKRLPSAITDSSLTKNNKNDYQLNLGLSYWF